MIPRIVGVFTRSWEPFSLRCGQILDLRLSGVKSVKAELCVETVIFFRECQCFRQRFVKMVEVEWSFLKLLGRGE